MVRGWIKAHGGEDEERLDEDEAANLGAFLKKHGQVK